MRATRLLGFAAIAVALCTGATGCVSTVTGTGSLAADAPGATGPASPDPSSSSPASDASPSSSSTPAPPATTTTTPAATPTVDPVKTKEQVTCVLVQATLKSTNDRFNAAKTREAQVQVLKTGAAGVRGGLDKSGLPRADRIYVAGVRVWNEMNKIVNGATKGTTPSTKPYNDATKTFRTACLSL